MIKIIRAIFLLSLILFSQHIAANDCWLLSSWKGSSATSDRNYEFIPDKPYQDSNPSLLCFDKNTGSVSDDDTNFIRLGESTLLGYVNKNGLELVESYQIDRKRNKVLFTKSRIGTVTAFPQLPDIVSAVVGQARKVSEK